MSIRESIAESIVEALIDIGEYGNAPFVTRQQFDFTKLSNAQYPAILVQTTGEIRGDSTIGDAAIRRMGTITYDIVGYVKSPAKSVDTARNQLIEAIEEALDVDRTRGGFAVDTQVTSVDVDDGSIDPIGGIVMTIAVEYFYTRGAV